MAIHFFTEDCDHQWKNKNLLKKWIKNAVENEGYKIKEVNYIACSDDYLLKMNVDYLKHHTLTDIITFDNSEKEGKIIGDIFISIDRVNENASKFKVKPNAELCRVIIHGTLHLMGYKDKSTKDKTLMTQKEDFYLAKRKTNGK